MNPEPSPFQSQISAALPVLKSSGIILYPTDTIWGIGCNATDEIAVKKIYQLKERDEMKSLIILVADQAMIQQYVADAPTVLLNYLAQCTRPTTAVFNQAIHLPAALVSADGTIAIRIVQDGFCRELIRQLQKPLVSTSANISGAPYPKNFAEIDPVIKNGVDLIVQHRLNDFTSHSPSSLVRMDEHGNILQLR